MPCAGYRGLDLRGHPLFKAALAEALAEIGRDPIPTTDFALSSAGAWASPLFGDELVRQLPPKVQVHRFKEPDKNNLITPTVKTSCVLGVLALVRPHRRRQQRRRAARRLPFPRRVETATASSATSSTPPSSTTPGARWALHQARRRGALHARGGRRRGRRRRSPGTPEASCSLGNAAVGQRLCCAPSGRRAPRSVPGRPAVSPRRAGGVGHRPEVGDGGEGVIVGRDITRCVST